ncbi:TetR family transcriptional regulator [Pseudonocardia sp. HH130630-07]|uniref:TetR family transcriptional regulator n=1 Tax=Pseudonocardia sp. HH130630-07 TaxID=1690815 RepID=UPI00081504C6|nr:TetR family transcriptional regulator [Pseudonocardia sp. HH130630-07]ANY08966.1 TetR family transcriptional regulator [Pseudonocardia sp. HH130630-07]
MPKDGSATRRRLLDAAAAEFSRHGIAGARVDRIADAAAANKAQIYAWFSSKDGLFDAVFTEHLALIIGTVPFDAFDLPGYVTGLYDAYLDRPEIVRLAVWARLERMPTGDLLGAAADQVAAKTASVRAAQEAGVVDPELATEDVYPLVIGLSLAWSPASPTIAADPADTAAEHDRRRAALAAAARRAFRPGT